MSKSLPTGRQANVKLMPKVKHKAFFHLIFEFDLAGRCPDEPCLVGGVKGHNVNDISLPGSVAFWAESFKFAL